MQLSYRCNKLDHYLSSGVKQLFVFASISTNLCEKKQAKNSLEKHLHQSVIGQSQNKRKPVNTWKFVNNIKSLPFISG